MVTDIALDSQPLDKPLVTCPLCGKPDCLEVKKDAWAVFSLLGLSATEGLVLSKDFDTQVFDDYHIQCGSCGERIAESDLLAHLRELK
jgi:hypothetical protein